MRVMFVDASGSNTRESLAGDIACQYDTQLSVVLARPSDI